MLMAQTSTPASTVGAARRSVSSSAYEHSARRPGHVSHSSRCGAAVTGYSPASRPAASAQQLASRRRRRRPRSARRPARAGARGTRRRPRRAARRRAARRARRRGAGRRSAASTYAARSVAGVERVGLVVDDELRAAALLREHVDDARQQRVAERDREGVLATHAAGALDAPRQRRPREGGVQAQDVGVLLAR